jgi:PAS domain S-box-containing protein
MATKIENKLEQIFEDALYAMFFIDNMGIIRYANKKYAHICKTTKERLLGKNIARVCKSDFIHVLRTGRYEFGEILEINGQLTVVNRIPIKEGEKVNE